MTISELAADALPELNEYANLDRDAVKDARRAWGNGCHPMPHSHAELWQAIQQAHVWIQMLAEEVEQLKAERRGDFMAGVPSVEEERLRVEQGQRYDEAVVAGECPF